MEKRAEALQGVIKDVILPESYIVDSQRQFPEKSIRSLAQAGFFKLTVPEQYGGWGAKPTEVAKTVNLIGRACASTAMVYVMHLTSVNTLVFYADDEQRNKYLQPVVDGKSLVTEAISEPGSGSQWWSLTSKAATTAEGNFHIQANKSFATSGGHADLYTVSTRAPDQEDHKKHALFIVKNTDPGIKAGDWNGVGLVGNMSGSISFDCVLEKDRMLYGGDGSDEGIKLYNEANQPIYHLGVSSVYTGIARAAYEATVDRINKRKYANNATVHGKDLSNYPVAQRHIGSMAIRLLQAESLVGELSRQMDQKTPFEDLAVMMTATKVAAAEAAFDIAHEAMMASGGSSYIKGLMPLERYLRDSLAASLMGPNDDFCKELIGRLELKLGSYHDL